MPIYTKYAQLRTPLGPEADDVPGDLQRLAVGIDTLLNLQATDESDRDARYGDAPVGTLVSLTRTGQLHWRGLDGWVIVARHAERIEGALTPSSSDWSPGSNTLTVSSSGVVMLYVTLLYQGSGISVPPSGNITNTDVGTIDKQYAPSALTAPMSTSTTGRLCAGSVSIGGGLSLNAVSPGGGDISNGETLQMVGTWSL